MRSAMAAVTFASKLQDDGSLVVPQEAVEALGLHPGDEVRVRVEAANGISPSEQPDQAELQRRAERLFEEADRLVPEPGRPLTDPYEAAWAQGVEEKARKMGLKL
jgi:bifunctional DNA-binding transcriptional regulator/antitoxin component of YhaV-PrlF toxin-antitoxin module